MTVIAVEHLDVDTGFTHAASEFAKLSRLVLLYLLHDDVTDGHNTNSRSLKRSTRYFAILDKEVRDALTIDHPCAAALDAHADSSEGFAHLAERARTVFKFNRKVLQSLFPFRRGMRAKHHIEHRLPRFTTVLR